MNRTVSIKTPFSVTLLNRESYRSKNKSFFYHEPYRTQIWSVNRFINGKNGKMDVFWFGTVRAFCKNLKLVRFLERCDFNRKRYLALHGTVRAF